MTENNYTINRTEAWHSFLESAIFNTALALKDADLPTAAVLRSHLKSLCSAQLKRLDPETKKDGLLYTVENARGASVFLDGVEVPDAVEAYIGVSYVDLMDRDDSGSPFCDAKGDIAVTRHYGEVRVDMPKSK